MQQSALSRLVQSLHQKGSRTKERRVSVRHIWTQFNGTVILPDEQREIKITPCDVSKHGISFYTLEPLEVGEVVLIIYKERAVRFEVKWREPRDDKLMFCYGLKPINPNYHLTSIFLDN